ncbi:ThiF family adenylyltransferase [Corallococcus aberystwythensis]|uniref:Thiamine biosynthesis protein ThiF n=1 Tax=Corallococcus aberystwythensis TaxID=2316722 RepID=A0A3A8Q5I3_9BACT|nr:ThiF family adenylyltransferase [Corallococcus aberystwythensis]RKH62220.1 thiamine biosynthesis protein ThiF [Corallococcus aberystwythensis]
MTNVNPRFQRNLGVLHPQTMDKLASTHVLIAGVGGAGGQCAVDLARLGFGCLTLADFDVYERHNINRQVGCFESTLGQYKVDVVERMCRDIHPDLRVHKVKEGITDANVADVLKGLGGLPPVDYVVEVIDIAGARAKESLHQTCRDTGIPIMTGLMLGFGAALHVFQPDAPLYEEMFILPDGRIDLPKIIPHLGSYMLQEYMDACYQGKGHAPTCVIGATTAAGLMVSEIMRGVMLGARAMVSWPEYLYVDLFDHRYVRGSVSAARPARPVGQGARS